MDRVEEADQICSNLWERFIFSLFLFLLLFGTANLGSRHYAKKVVNDRFRGNERTFGSIPVAHEFALYVVMVTLDV